jgi:ketosteroid isomerase-like protein
VTEQKTAGGLDFEALRRAIEESDGESLKSFYAEDAELYTINRNAPPSSPNVVRGKEEIAEYIQDVCGRDMTHRVEREVIGQDRIAFNEACEYSDGIKVLGAMTLEVRDGKIVQQVSVEAWDE